MDNETKRYEEKCREGGAHRWIPAHLFTQF